MRSPWGDERPRRALGRIDITDETSRYFLYRTTVNGTDRWVIEVADGRQVPFEREVFEKALMSLLK